MTPDHECKHEVDFALMNANIKRILESQSENKDSLKEIYIAIKGNGKDGLESRISKANVKLNVQWGLFLALFGLIAWILKT